MLRAEREVACDQSNLARLDDEVEFVAILWFDSLEAVRGFGGEDYEIAHVPPQARAVLARFDARSQHYETRLSPEG